MELPGPEGFRVLQGRYEGLAQLQHRYMFARTLLPGTILDRLKKTCLSDSDPQLTCS